MKVDDTVEGRYRIERPLGEGGMGKVFLAHDLMLDKRVAIKTLLPGALADMRSVEQLKMEVRLTQDLRQENICGVYHFQVSGAEPFVVMEFIDGEKLTNFIFRQPGHRCDEVTFRRLAAQILAAVEHAHRAGVIHRDLTSGNIMVRHDGCIRVMDFGIAASLKDAQSRATGSEVAVSIHYASPEQINGEKPAASMDIYSLGCVFYEMLVGQPPFRQGDVIHQQLTRQPDPMLGVSPLLNQAVLACLAKDPRKRPGSAEDLRAALDGRRIPRQAPLADHTIKITRAPAAARRTWIGVIWGAAAVLVVIATVLLVNSAGPARPPNPVPSGPVPALAPAAQAENPAAAVDISQPPNPDPARQQAAEVVRQQAARQSAEDLAREQATEKAQQEAEDRRTRAREYVTRGDSQFANSDWQSAMKAYETALTIDSSNSDARQGFARAQKNWRAECSALNTCK